MKTLAISLGLLLNTTVLMAQKEQPKDTIQEPITLDEVLVSAVRVTAQSPVTFSNISKREIRKRNLGQDIPILMNFLPGVVTTTDAGAGVGYTGIRVRGSDATRVNVTINGIPYNDAESQGTFWVNMPDFASSTESLQLQRGVGTSTNGSGAFGASLNILTDAASSEANGEIANSFGSYATRKHTVKFSTGLLNNHFELAGRVSAIASDGYIDRATSDLKSYFLQGVFTNKNTLIKALVFGGHEVTYQAWNGIEDLDMLENNRRFNSAGALYDENGNIVGYHDNEVDDYKQDHAQLHWNQKINTNWSTNLAFHYTRGSGFFEQYKQGASFSDYGMTSINLGGEAIDETDLIRRKWLENDFYGFTFSVNFKDKFFDFIIGGGWNKYVGDHFGEVIWARYASDSEINDHYYDDRSHKTDFNIFSKVTTDLGKGWSFFGDLQYRRVAYKANGEDTGIVDDQFDFFNPKAGFTYELNNNNQMYVSYARAQREPNRNDYEEGNPKPEKLNDFELGWRYASGNVKLNTNAYYMRYKDQLVLTGGLNDVGAPIRANSGDSYRLGLEVDATFVFGSQWVVRPNLALSTNRNIDFVFQRDGSLMSLGNTHISYSPEVVVGNIVTYAPIENLQFSVLSKYVGDQYMGNIDAEGSKLDSYFINDLNIVYELNLNSVFKTVAFSALLNNIFNVRYVSNGYFYTYDDDWSNPGLVTTIEGAGYYPQATRNFLVGATITF